MKYFRLMSYEEAQKVYNNKLLTREGQKKWILEENLFYFISEEDGGIEKLKEIAPIFMSEEKELFIIGFESKIILKRNYVKDLEGYDLYESIVKEYSSETMKPFGFIRSGENFFFDEWLDKPFIYGKPSFQKIKNDLSKSFNDRNYSPDKKTIKKACLNLREKRKFKKAFL